MWAGGGFGYHPLFACPGNVRLDIRASVTYVWVMSETLVKVLFRIPESDRRALKILAAERDTSSTELVRRLIRQYLVEHSARKGA